MKYFLILSIITLVAEAVDVTNPIFWERSFSLNVTNPNAYGSLIQSTSFIVSSQDFQGLNTLSDYKTTPERIVFNFGECCLSSNTTMATLDAMNFNSIQVPALQSAQNMALVKRGNCNWSEKISVVNNLSLVNNLNITAVMIYDNDTHGASIDISSTAITGVGSIAPPDFSTPLPSTRDILNFTDNDLHSSSDPVVYFVPNNYGQTFVKRLNAMYNSSNPSMRYYWLMTPYFDQVTWGFSGGDSFFAAGKGYLSYIIALAAIFVIACIVIRWWRIRRARLYGGNMTDSNGFPMQPRTNQLDPLPVDIVNKLPIEVYSPDIIKNENCAVCLEDFVPGKSDIRILPCGHGFCVLCIDPWLTQKSTLCPICKHDCLPADLRAERDLENNNHQEPPYSTIANSTPPPPIVEIPTTSHQVNPPTHITIPPILTTAVLSPPPSPTHTSDKNPFVDPASSSLHSVPSTSAPSTSAEDPPAFTAIDLSPPRDEKKEH